MGKLAVLEVKESVDFLKKLSKEQKKLKNRDRLLSLVLIKECKFKTREELAEYLGYHIRTMERWLSKYKNGGITGMLIADLQIRKSHIITSQIHDALGARLNKEDEGFQSYVEAYHWVRHKFKVEISYNGIRSYMIRHFKCKIKSPRKSHIKKDPKAVAAFLKTT